MIDMIILIILEMELDASEDPNSPNNSYSE